MGGRWLAVPLALVGLLAGGMPAARAHQDSPDAARSASSVPAAWRHPVRLPADPHPGHRGRARVARRGHRA